MEKITKLPPTNSFLNFPFSAFFILLTCTDRLALIFRTKFYFYFRPFNPRPQNSDSRIRDHMLGLILVRVGHTTKGNEHQRLDVYARTNWRAHHRAICAHRGWKGEANKTFKTLNFVGVPNLPTFVSFLQCKASLTFHLVGKWHQDLNLRPLGYKSSPIRKNITI